MTAQSDSAVQFAVNLPNAGAARSTYSIGKFIFKFGLQCTAQVSNTGSREGNANQASPREEVSVGLTGGRSSTFDTTRQNSQTVDNLGLGVSYQEDLGNDCKRKIQAGLSLVQLEEVAQKIADGAGRGEVLGSLLSGISGELSCSPVSFSGSWDSDLCFFKVAGNFSAEPPSAHTRRRPGEVTLDAGVGIAVEASVQFGLSEQAWGELFELVLSKVPNQSMRTFAMRVRAFFVNTFGASARTGARSILPRIAGLLRGAFAAMSAVAPFLWAIDIALVVEDLLVSHTRSVRARGYREGQLVAFATMFTHTIFNNPREFETGAVGEIQAKATQYADRYHGRRRIAVQRFLIVNYGNDQWRGRRSDIQALGERFGINGLGPMAGSGQSASRDSQRSRRPGTENGELPQINHHVSRVVNRYFVTFLNRWVDDWDSEN